jgi:hypothetical protein
MSIKRCDRCGSDVLKEEIMLDNGCPRCRPLSGAEVLLVQNYYNKVLKNTARSVKR